MDRISKCRMLSPKGNIYPLHKLRTNYRKGGGKGVSVADYNKDSYFLDTAGQLHIQIVVSTAPTTPM